MNDHSRGGSLMLRLPAVKNRVALSRSSIYAAIKKGTFPAPIRLSERCVAWQSTEIETWLAERIHASREGVSA